MEYAFWLANAGITNGAIHRLLQQVGSAEELFRLPESSIKKLENITAESAERLCRSKRRMEELKREFDSLASEGVVFLSLEGEEYPEKLRNTADAPYGLYLKGRLMDASVPSVAIVGARMCSEYGRAMALELGRALSARKAVVVSGMARGIDTAGHQGALQANGTTIAVLGGGVDVIYPASNRRLYQQILEKGGAILSEHPPGTQPLAGYFPARNRIISGLSDVVIVVEAKERSGSLITADYALEQGKDIYAVPGRVTDALSGGCNNLIRQGAGIISDVGELLNELDLLGESAGIQQNFQKILLEKEELLVYSCVDLRPKSIEELLQKTGFSVPQMLTILASLEQKGFVNETFKNCYIRRF
jgi:DNA processing protein